MNFHCPDDGALAHQAPLEAGLRPSDMPQWRVRAAAGLLLALSIGYAMAPTATLPHRLALAEAVSVCLAGAIRGLLVTSLRWMARPSVFGPALRRRAIGVSPAGAMGVAALSFIAPHFRA